MMGRCVRNAVRPGGYAVNGKPEVNRVAMVSVRPGVVAGGEPEHVDAAASLTLYDGRQLPRSRGEAARAISCPLRPQRGEPAKGVCRSASLNLPYGEEIRDAVLFL